MLERLKRTFKDRDTYVVYIASILLPILFWYESSKDNLETWKGWLSLIMTIIVSGMLILLFMVTILEVVFDVPVEKSEQIMIDLFNSFLALLFNNRTTNCNLHIILFIWLDEFYSCVGSGNNSNASTLTYEVNG